MSGQGMTFEMFDQGRRPGAAPPRAGTSGAGPTAARTSGDAPPQDAAAAPARGARAPLLADFGRGPSRLHAQAPTAARPQAAAAPAGAQPARTAAAGAPSPRAAATSAAPAGAAAHAENRRLARLRGEARAQGYSEGVAASEAETQAELRLIAADLREGLAEALHSIVEREQAMAGRMQELAEALLAAAAPAFARAGLASEVAEAVGAALRETGEDLSGRLDVGAMTVRVAPEQAERTRIALAAAGFAAPVSADPRLGPLRAELDWGGGADRIDLGAALAAARATLERHLDAQERTVAHG